MKPDYGPKSFASCLQEAPSLATIQQKIQQLQQINQLLPSLLSTPLPLYCRVANYRQNILVIETVNASWLLRLRYEQMNLLTALRQRLLPALVTIEFMVNPELAYRGIHSLRSSNNRAPAAREITPHTAKNLRQFAEVVPGKLQAILLQLASLAYHSPADPLTMNH